MRLVFVEEGNATGEGKALRLLAEIYAKQEQHKAAIRHLRERQGN